MDDESAAVAGGHVSAMFMVLSAVIQVLPAVQAAEAAVVLKIDQVDTQNRDQEDGTPLAAIRSRDAIVDGFLGLLSAVAKRG